MLLWGLFACSCIRSNKRWKLEPLLSTIHRERNSSLLSFVCSCICNCCSLNYITVPHLAPWRAFPTSLLDLTPPPLFFFSFHPQSFCSWQTEERDATANEILECFRAGRKWSRKNTGERSLSCLFGGRAKRKRQRGARWGIGKGRKRGKREEQWTQWIKIS